MRRVIIESPFAPRTPLPSGEQQCRRPESCDTDCLWCAIRAQRAYESDLHARYLDACLLDCLRRGEAPFASHGLYARPGVLDDLKTEERAQGIAAGFAWRGVADATVIYTDLGWSDGMNKGAADATRVIEGNWVAKRPAHVIEYRTLGGEWSRP